MEAGTILALRVSDQTSEIFTPTGIVEVSGYRSVLSVGEIWAKTQTTVMFGLSLYMIGHDAGMMNPQQAFNFFLKGYINKPMTWGQLVDAPPANVYHRPFNAVVPQHPPTGAGTMTLLASGYDPLRNYWCEFAGNYFLTAPIFKNWPRVIQDGVKRRP